MTPWFLIPSANVYKTLLFSMGRITFFQDVFLLRSAAHKEGPGSRARPHGPGPHGPHGPNVTQGALKSLDSMDFKAFGA